MAAAPRGSRLTNVVSQAEKKRHHRERPEDGAEGLGHAKLKVGWLVLDVEGQGDGDRYDGHVH